MSVKAWAQQKRSSNDHQDGEYQDMINAFESLLEGHSTPQATARNIAAICEPLIKRDPSNPRNGTVWDILCDAVRVLGGSKDINDRLIDLLSSMIELPEVKDERGTIIKHEWGGRYWTDLPMWALTFREYGIGTLGSSECVIFVSCQDSFSYIQCVKQLSTPTSQWNQTRGSLKHPRSLTLTRSRPCTSVAFQI